MALLELRIIMSFPKRFKYRRSVSTQINEAMPIEGKQSGVD